MSYQNKPIRLDAGQTIYAKGIDALGNETKKVSSYTSTIPSDVLCPSGYDNDYNTYCGYGEFDSATIYLDASIRGKPINLKITNNASWNASIVHFYDSAGVEVDQITLGGGALFNSSYVVPNNAVKIRFFKSGSSWGYTVYEIQPANEPIITAIKNYPTLTQTGVSGFYNNVTINYYPTSVQKLYRIGDTGPWLNHTINPIKLENGQTIYAKGIDALGNETRKISTYTATTPADAIPSVVYDGDLNTSSALSTAAKYMAAGSDIIGKKLSIKWYVWGGTAILAFLDENKTLISYNSFYVSYGAETRTNTYPVPENTKFISLYNASGTNGSSVFEIQYTE